MKRALVIRTTGDPALAGAIMDGMTRVIPVDDGAAARMEAKLAVMLPRDVRYWRRKIKSAQHKYACEQVGAVRGRVMGLWACVYMAARGACLRALGGGESERIQ